MNSKFETKLRKFVKPAAITGGALALADKARAALPTEVTTAIDTAGTDLQTAATAIIAAMVVVWGIRKLGQKMGWW